MRAPRPVTVRSQCSTASISPSRPASVSGFCGLNGHGKFDSAPRDRGPHRMAKRFDQAQRRRDRRHPERWSGALHASDRAHGGGAHAARRCTISWIDRSRTPRQRRYYASRLARTKDAQGARPRHFPAAHQSVIGSGRSALWGRAAHGEPCTRPDVRCLVVVNR